MRELLRKHHISVRTAIAGIVWAFTVHPNFRVHIALSLIAIVLGVYFGITRIEMTIILFTIVLGLSAEMINTAIEAMTDLITKEWRAEARIAKDVAAGMTLTVAVGASIIAVFIFWPYLARMVRGF